MDDKYLMAAADEWRRVARNTSVFPMPWKVAMALADLFETAAERAFSDETGPHFDILAELTTGKSREEFMGPAESDDEAYWRSILNDPQGRVPNDEDLSPSALYE